MEDDISLEFIEYLIKELSIDELYDLYATAIGLLKENRLKKNDNVRHN